MTRFKILFKKATPRKRRWCPLKRQLWINHHERLNWNTAGAQRLWFDHLHQHFWNN